jgi:release factor glutamine methyltransferase
VRPHPSPIASRQSLRESLRDAIVQLEREHVPSAALAAELLLMHVLGRDRAWIYAHTEHELNSEERDRYSLLVARRASGVPTQHLTGRQEFWGLDFEVTPDVLIPRPETEHVIEVAIERLVAQASACGSLSEQDRSSLDQPPQAQACATQDLRIADVGTGSGCIAVALASELPVARLTATDISPAALEVARRNAQRHGVASQIDFIECNLLDAVPRESRSLDLIVSNPPYIGHREAAALPREVRDHEPHTALFAGETGIELYAPLVAQAAVLLKPGGFVVLELGHDSAEYVTGVLSAPEWSNLSITNDLAGIPRVASAQRHG